jgi:hypothetical protein
MEDVSRNIKTYVQIALKFAFNLNELSLRILALCIRTSELKFIDLKARSLLEPTATL